MSRRVVFIFFAAAFSLVAVWCLMWVFSSTSLACTACDCVYSLFHENPRCRQPYFAMIGSALAALAAIVCIVVAIPAPQK